FESYGRGMRPNIREAQLGPMSLVSDRAASTRPRTRDEFLAGMSAIRQQYLEALPIAAALIAGENGQFEVHTNAAYALLDHGGGDDRRSVIERGQFTSEINAFMAGDDAIFETEWSDGGPIVGRHYSVRLARMTSLHLTN